MKVYEMNKKEKLLKKIEELKEKIEELEEEENIIKVPENVKIEGNCGDGDGLGIVFNEQHQKLFYKQDLFSVLPVCEGDFIDCKLVPCKWEDLKEGDTFHMCDVKNGGFYYVNLYGKKLNKNEYVTVYNNEDGVETTNVTWNYYWKVVPIED